MPGLQYIAVKAKFPATALRSFRSGEAQWRVRVLKVCLSDTTVVLLCISPPKVPRFLQREAERPKWGKKRHLIAYSFARWGR